MTTPYFISATSSDDEINGAMLIKEHYDQIIDLKRSESSEIIKKTINANIDKRIAMISENTQLIMTPIYSNLPSTITLYVSNDPCINIRHNEKNVIYFGVDTELITRETQNYLDTTISPYYTIQKIKEREIGKILINIKKMITGHNIKMHLIIDLRIIDKDCAPCVKRITTQSNYLNINEINEMITELKSSIWYIDCLGFDYKMNDSTGRYAKLTSEMCRMILRNTFDIKDKTVNIFTEDSRFLIYRPVKQIYNTYTDKKQDAYEADIGWYILRFLTLAQREELLKNLDLIDKVIRIPIDSLKDENENPMEVYITSTSINEQNKKSFHACSSIFDYCLFPQEKVSMMPELLNTIVESQSS